MQGDNSLLVGGVGRRAFQSASRIVRKGDEGKERKGCFLDDACQTFILLPNHYHFVWFGRIEPPLDTHHNQKRTMAGVVLAVFLSQIPILQTAHVLTKSHGI